MLVNALPAMNTPRANHSNLHRISQMPCWSAAECRVGADMFHFAGKEYLLAVDFFSGFKWVTEMKKLDTNEVIKHFSHWFSQGCGFPRSLRCDSGPQFRSSLNNWLDEMGIVRETSSAYNPQSNGLAEKSVQDIKACIKKQTGKW